jgi:hypothetical protein
MSRKKPIRTWSGMNSAFPMRTRANKETRASRRPGFSESPRGRRIIGPQALCACRIRQATLSESVKIQNQKLPLDDANIECVANYFCGAPASESKLSV